MLAASTGRTESRPCEQCGATVVHRELVYGSSEASGTHWTREAHAAPCGLPCMGGGAGGGEGLRAVREGRMHGLTGRPCPTCDNTEPVHIRDREVTP